MEYDHVGLFITLSAYGNRLHGDERGTVDRWSNGYAEPPLEMNNARAGWERRIQAFPPVTFDAMARQVIEVALHAAADFKNWTVHACQCRTNHAHIVVATTAGRTEVISRLKTRSTVALHSAGLLPNDQSAWARKGSGRYLWSDKDIAAAALYVIEGQGHPLPGSLLREDTRSEDRARVE